MIWTPKRDLIVPRHLKKRQGGWFTPAAFMKSVSFPVIAAAATGGNGTGNSATVNLPAGITAGDLLLLIGCFSGQINTLSASGYSWSGTNYSNANVRAVYKIATGSEGASIGVSWDNNRVFVWRSYRITGVRPTSFIAYGDTSPSHDPPNLTPSWGSTKTLWIAAACTTGNSPASTGYPSNCPDNRFNQLRSVGFNQDVLQQIASANVQAASFNPTTFTVSTDNLFTAATIAIRPA